MNSTESPILVLQDGEKVLKKPAKRTKRKDEFEEMFDDIGKDQHDDDDDENEGNEDGEAEPKKKRKGRGKSNKDKSTKKDKKQEET